MINKFHKQSWASPFAVQLD